MGDDFGLNLSKPVGLPFHDANSLKLINLPPVLQPYKQTACAYVSSLIALGTGYPLDSIKTRLQTYKYKSVWQCIVDTKKNEGVAGFYRGITAPLLSSSAVRTLTVSIYTYSKRHWSRSWRHVYEPASLADSTAMRVLKNSPISFSAGASAGIVSCIISCPFEFAKLASQIELLAIRKKSSNGVNDQVKARSTLQVAKDLIRAKGFVGLYSGVRYQFARDFIGSGVYFLAYDSFKLALSELAGRAPDKFHPASIALAGAMAGTFCWVVVYPLDTYKSLVQRDIVSHTFNGGNTLRPHRTFDFKSLFRRNTYRGLGISVARTSVLGMTFFSCYEMFLTLC